MSTALGFPHVLAVGPGWAPVPESRAEAGGFGEWQCGEAQCVGS